jgi:NADH:ubiquinone oxidoreductase subunit F (NADH-binding)
VQAMDLIYIRAEYPLAIERLKIAINQARENGLLGNNIFGTGFNFDIKLAMEQVLLYAVKRLP